LGIDERIPKDIIASRNNERQVAIRNLDSTEETYEWRAMIKNAQRGNNAL
jgi:hypothetical protein